MKEGTVRRPDPVSGCPARIAGIESVRALVLASVLCGAGTAAGAEEKDRISSDRPDFLTSPDVVGKGRFQIETGALVQRDDPAGNTRTRTLSTPTLLRLGVTDKVELQLETDGRMRTRETDLPTQSTVRAHGYADTAIAIKWNTHEGNEEKGEPGIGWVFQATMPSGSRAFRGRGVRPAVIGAFEWDLPNEMALGANAGLAYDNSDTGGRFFSGTLGVGLSKHLTDRLTIAAEIVAQQIARKQYGGNVAVADVGMTYLLTKSVQVDALVGRGLTNESPKYLFTVGISARF
jgi:hypothetical protein